MSELHVELVTLSTCRKSPVVVLVNVNITHERTQQNEIMSISRINY